MDATNPKSDICQYVLGRWLVASLPTVADVAVAMGHGHEDAVRDDCGKDSYICIKNRRVQPRECLKRYAVRYDCSVLPYRKVAWV